MAINNLREESLSEREKRNLSILETLRRFGPVTRPEISRLVGLNIVTVSNYIEEFLNKNLVFEKEFDISEGGRRPILLDINPDSGMVVGVGVNLLNIVGVLADMKGRVITRSTLERKDIGVRDIVGCIIEVIANTLNKTKDNHSKVRGIGIGIAGIINKKDGSVRWPEKVGNRYDYASVYVPLKSIIEKEFGLPVAIENDATAACFGEQWMDLEPGIKNLIYMFSGVGCGIMINGQIYTGATGSAGEISIYNPKEETPFTCQAGNPCFLKRADIDFGIVNEARLKTAQSAGAESAGKRLLELSGNDAKNISLKHIFQAAKENDPLSVELVEKAARQLGIKAAFLVNLLNPQALIIGGGLEQAGDRFLSIVRSTVNEWAFEEMASSVKIIYSTLGENAVSLGAASLLMRMVFSQA